MRTMGNSEIKKNMQEHEMKLVSRMKAYQKISCCMKVRKVLPVLRSLIR